MEKKEPLNMLEKSIELLEVERKKTKDDRWIDHCLCVGNSAGKIAKALNEKGYPVDVDKLLLLVIYTILVNTMVSHMGML